MESMITDGNAAIKKAEQNPRIALKYAHRGYILDTGNIVLEGSAQDLLQNEEIKKVYLGNNP